MAQAELKTKKTNSCVDGSLDAQKVETLRHDRSVIPFNSPSR